MIRTLFIIAGAALVLCMVTLGGAIALGGHDLQRHGWAWTIKDRDGESIRFERIKSGGTDDLGPFTTRTLTWTGGEALTIDSSIDVEYVQGPANTVVITGPKRLTDRVTLTDRVRLGRRKLLRPVGPRRAARRRHGAQCPPLRLQRLGRPGHQRL